MNYKVLYRKYRPDSFDTLVGQKPIVEILKNSIKENKIAHAYIFSGPRGTGKTSTARILAKSINCLDNQDGIACGKCANCQSFNTSPDIIEIDAASNNGVGDIRELINNIKIMPTSLKYKIYIIDEVHMLSDSAYNALLLTLEEPPEHAIFILATTNIENVPITILSRCQKFDFKKISKNDIVNQLKYICEQEKIAYKEEALNEIALLADGGLRDALSILDQLSKISAEITIDLVEKEIGSVSNKVIDDLIISLDSGNIDNIEKIINDFRNININYKVVIKKMIDSLAQYAIQILRNGIKNHLTYDDLRNIIIDLNEIINKINVSIDPYTIIEIILLKYVQENCENNQKIPEKVEISEKKVSNISENEIVDKPKDIPKVERKSVIKPKEKIKLNVDVRINNCFVDASKDALNTAKMMWQKFTDNVDNYLKGLISDTQPVTASSHYIILEATIKHKDQELNQEINLIEANFNEINSSDLKLVFIDSERWLKEKENYIKNIRNGYKYTLEPEKIESQNSLEDKEVNSNDIEKIANDIFDVNKLEIK